MKKNELIVNDRNEFHKLIFWDCGEYSNKWETLVDIYFVLWNIILRQKPLGHHLGYLVSFIPNIFSTALSVSVGIQIWLRKALSALKEFKKTEPVLRLSL